MVLFMLHSFPRKLVLTLLLGHGGHTTVQFMERGILPWETRNGNMTLQPEGGRIGE